MSHALKMESTYVTHLILIKNVIISNILKIIED